MRSIGAVVCVLPEPEDPLTLLILAEGFTPHPLSSCMSFKSC
jgi:hypothetical protein